MRVGVIGRGFGAMIAPAYAQTDGCTVVDVVSPRDEKAVAALCRRRDVDLISVHSPPFLHERDVLHAIGSGHHVVCDKPFGSTLAEAERMEAAASGDSNLHLTNFEFRMEPWRQATHELLSRRTLGTVEQILWTDVSSSWQIRTDGWQVDAATGGGWLGASGSHVLDTLRWWTGDLDIVTAVLFHLADRAQADTGAAVVLQASAGTGIAFTTTGVASHPLGSRVVLCGSQAVLERATDGSLRLNGAAWPDDVERAVPPPDSFRAALGAWCEAVRDAVRGGDSGTLPTFADGLACARLLADVKSGAVRDGHDRALGPASSQVDRNG
jgi:predicted dehydrogenase